MKATVRLIMAPTRAAVRANSNRSGLNSWVRALVWPGAFKMTSNAERAPATIQVSVDVRRIHTPDSRAESAFSDMARMERPHGVVRTATARAMATIGATINVSTSPGVKMTEPRENEMSKGTGTGLYRFLGRMKGRAVSANST